MRESNSERLRRLLLILSAGGTVNDRLLRDLQEQAEHETRELTSV